MSSSAKRWVAANPGDGRASAINNSIANTPMARWFGSWSGSIGSATSSFTGAADSRDKLPILVAYNVYNRDYCGGHSAGGASSPSAYASWISQFAGGIGNRPALVILEPDSLGDYGCMNQAQIAERQSMLSGAVSQFSRQAPNTWVYMDAGNPAWTDASTMAMLGAGAMAFDQIQAVRAVRPIDRIIGGSASPCGPKRKRSRSVPW